MGNGEVIPSFSSASASAGCTPSSSKDGDMDVVIVLDTDIPIETIKRVSVVTKAKTRKRGYLFIAPNGGSCGCNNSLSVTHKYALKFQAISVKRALIRGLIQEFPRQILRSTFFVLQVWREKLLTYLLQVSMCCTKMWKRWPELQRE